MKKPRVRNRGGEIRAIGEDADAVDPRWMDKHKLTFLELDMSPQLRAQIRARTTLRQLTIRLSAAQLDATREVAQRIGEPYQRLLRQWISDGLRREQRVGKSKRVS